MFHRQLTLIEKNAFDALTSTELNQATKEIDDEIHKYFLTVIPKRKVENFDILKFWKNHSTTIPGLAEFSNKILCIPATSTSIERVFSHVGMLINAKRSSFEPTVINKTLFIHDYYKLVKNTFFEPVIKLFLLCDFRISNSVIVVTYELN